MVHLDSRDVDLSHVREALLEFAAEFVHLTLYHRICSAAALDDEVASVLTHARPGQARPVLLLAAIHDLVLAHPEIPAARWYSSVVGAAHIPTDGDPWPQIRAAIIDHRATLERTVAERSTQTNEVNRVAFLAPVIAEVCADEPARHLALVELGASAGLLLAPDRYDVQLQLPGGGVRRYGDDTSPVHCRALLTDDSTPLAGVALPRIVARRGIDAQPQSLLDPAAVRWLEACLWPDQPSRVERFAAAAALVRSDPPVVVRGDLIEGLPALLDDTTSGLDPDSVQLVVFSSWALTYVSRPRRTAVPAILAAFAARTGIPVSWVTAEPAGAVPGIPLPPGWSADDTGTVLGVRTWRGVNEAPPRLWGTCHPHGEWLTRLA